MQSRSQSPRYPRPAVGNEGLWVKRLPENKNPVIGQTAQASGIPTSSLTKWSLYSTRQLSFRWKN